MNIFHEIDTFLHKWFLALCIGGVLLGALVGSTYALLEKIVFKPETAIESAGEKQWISTTIQHKYRIEPTRADLITAFIQGSSVEYDIRPTLIMAMIQVESSYKSRPGQHGEVGFMQVKPKFWKRDCGKYDIHSKYENIFVGACALRYNMNLTKNVEDALTAYNIGFTDFDRDANLLKGFEYRDKILKEERELLALANLPVDTN